MWRQRTNNLISFIAASISCLFNLKS